VFFFDRQYLEALPEDTVALLDAETPTLEPKIGLFDGMTKKKKKKNSIVQQELLIFFLFFFIMYFFLLESAELKALQNISSRQSLGQNCKQLLSLFAYFDSYSQVWF
jgi:hypothetical protein